MKWLDEIIDRVNAAGNDGEWATQSQVAASSAVDKLELPAIPDDAVEDLVGCLIDEVERLTRECDAFYCLCEQCKSQDTRLVKEAK